MVRNNADSQPRRLLMLLDTGTTQSTNTNPLHVPIFRVFTLYSSATPKLPGRRYIQKPTRSNARFGYIDMVGPMQHRKGERKLDHRVCSSPPPFLSARRERDGRMNRNQTFPIHPIDTVTLPIMSASPPSLSSEPRLRRREHAIPWCQGTFQYTWDNVVSQYGEHSVHVSHLSVV